MPRIVLEQREPSAEVLFEGETDVLKIGRKPECQVRLKSWGVSPRHADLVWRDGQLWIEDHQTTAGTWVNGEKVDEPVALPSSCELKLGPFVMRLTYEA